MHSRIKLLIAAHLAANVACMVGVAQVPLDVTYLPAMWACFSVPMAQILLLGFYVGMASRRLIGSLLALLLSAAFLAVTAALPSLLRSDYSVSPSAARDILYGILGIGTAIGLVALVFLAIRRWAARLWLLSKQTTPQTSRPLQFTIFHILLLMSVAAVLLSCGRYLHLARTESRWNAEDSPLFVVLVNAFVLSLFLLNILSAVWATLGRGRPFWRVALVVLTSTFLGVAMALATSFDPHGPSWQRWLTAAIPLTMSLLPTLIIAATLLVVRSCGYRLVPLRDLRRTHETPPDTSSAGRA